MVFLWLPLRGNIVKIYILLENFEESMLANNLASKIESYIVKENISISELERIAGLKKSAISNIIHGRSKNPSIEIIISIAKALSCSIEDLTSSSEMLGKYSANNNVTTFEYEWDKELYNECNAKLQRHLKMNKTQISIDTYITCLKEIYIFAKEDSSNIVNERFVKYVINRYIELTDTIDF